MNVFWDAVHPTLSYDYTIPSHLWCASDMIADLPNRLEIDCSEIADVIAGELARTISRPYILELASPVSHEGKCQLLIPNISKRGVEWLVHYVCADGDTIYDPILPAPAGYAEYVQRVFGDQQVTSQTVD